MDARTACELDIELEAVEVQSIPDLQHGASGQAVIQSGAATAKQIDQPSIGVGLDNGRVEGSYSFVGEVQIAHRIATDQGQGSTKRVPWRVLLIQI